MPRMIITVLSVILIGTTGCSALGLAAGAFNITTSAIGVAAGLVQRAREAPAVPATPPIGP